MDDSAIWKLTEAKTWNKSAYIDIKNENQFKLGSFDIDLAYGANYLSNKYQRIAKAENKDNYEYTPFSPSGKQEILSAYLESDIKKSIFSLNTNLTYTDGVVKGYKPKCDDIPSGNGHQVMIEMCIPKSAANIKLYSKSLNFSSMLSADINDWFKPFVSYSINSRLPNVQEVFFNNEGAGSMNPFLKPERAKTFQVGFNTAKNNVLTKDDFLGLKVTSYYSQISDYIYNHSLYITPSGELIKKYNPNVLPSFHGQMNMNSAEKVIQKGIEVNLNYDAGFAFANLAYSYQQSSHPVDASSKTGVGFGTVAVTELPRDYATLTVGGRLLDEKLTLASIFKHTGKSRRMKPAASDIEEQDTLQELPKIPLVIDIYATYQATPNILLKASIQNLTNRNYVDALNSLNSTISQVKEDYSYSYTNTARGRTYLIGAEIRF